MIALKRIMPTLGRRKEKNLNLLRNVLGNRLSTSVCPSRKLPVTHKIALLSTFTGIAAVSFLIFQGRVCGKRIEACLQKGQARTKAFLDKNRDLLAKLSERLPGASIEDKLLLPDLKTLSFPENMPTIVVGLENVIARIEYDRMHGWRLLKRPGVDQFFRQLIYHYEIVVWSRQPFPVAQEICMKWGIPITGVIHKDQCVERNGAQGVKDISKLGRDIRRVIILDCDKNAFLSHPENGVFIREYTGDPEDRELYFVTDFLRMVKNKMDLGNTGVQELLAKYAASEDESFTRKWLIEQEELQKKERSRREFGSKFLGVGELRGARPRG